ncbi:hypothetical protein [Clostridium formicaceticum]|uniref:Cohesin domain-containing protein n=1 Tax=Clostridium formicaceticum TaxID=1497 RepID=A0AAC9RR24_9CLOT|nr:hypothetical protein [Clostridium formicaceticum]AOY75333.1 hypothetical protein BJL90_05105 [Clostridium formicaceticum]ARE89782.1 hypothetical protein CLFO_42630 [Clostridium formicaceticum]
MIKKLLISTVVLLIIGGSGAVVYGNPTDASTTQETKVEQETLKVLTPNRAVVTSDKNMVLSFTAPEGTTVTIDVYYNASVATSKQNYVAAYDPIEVKIGALQRGWAEVELRKGLNKIDFTAVYKDGGEDTISRTVEVKDMNDVKKQVEESIASTSSTERLKSIVNTENE